MAVAQADYGRFHTLIGTSAEVMQALSDLGIPGNDIINIFYNGSNITAAYRV